MVEHAFFNSDWIDKVITFAASDPFPAKQWKIVRQLNEIHVQGDEKESQALGLFECGNPMDTSDSAVMKIYMQIPYPFTESLSHEDKAKEALPEAEISEERAMLALTKGGCESVPQLLNWKREKQDNNSGPVPGGYLVYLVLQNLPGVRLSCEDYWNFSGTQREEIREAFKVAYMDCFSKGIIRTGGKLGTSLIWDEATKKMFIVGLRHSRSPTETEKRNAWESNIWLAWGFGREVSNASPPVSSNIVQDGEGKLWEI